MHVQRFESSEGNVWKYVFASDTEVYEAVLYKYNDFYERTVICCSVMSGCPVGCTFCGTGKKFIRNLTSEEIIFQINHILNDNGITDIDKRGKRFQIMFMSMGEPMLNQTAVSEAIRWFHYNFPKTELLLSTIGVNNNRAFADILRLSKEIETVGLQFSIHRSNNLDRNGLIPYKNKWCLQQIRDAGVIWWNETGRHPYLNYCVDGTNNTKKDFENLFNLFSPVVFNFTFSVVCSKEESMKDAEYRNLEEIRDFEQLFVGTGYNTRIFDPAGQDDIGGGCGMLWYVQQWMAEHEKGENHE